MTQYSGYNSLAVYDIKTFLWDQLVQYGLFDPNDYLADGFDSPLVPIIPSQQIPEFNNLLPGKTYIVYDYEVLPQHEQWWLTHEMLQLMVVSIRHDEINTILNFITDLFRRYDDSIKDIEARAAILSNDFMFKYTTVARVFSPAPFKNEGGLMSGHIDVIVCYVRKLNPQGRFIT